MSTQTLNSAVPEPSIPALVDSHCHLPLVAKAMADPVAAIIRRATDCNVVCMLCVSVDLESFPEVLAVAESFANVYASVGIHPNSEHTEGDAIVDDLIRSGQNPRVIAIGETGLDYYRSAGDLTWQRDRFRHHIRAAKTLHKPLIIHSRDAAGDVIAILRAEGAREVGGVMHCFVDDWNVAQAAMDLGFYIAFTGIVTFRNATTVQDVARRIPLARLLLETDSPWLAPVPVRGKSNEPANVRHVAHAMARLRGEDLNDLAAATTANFCRLFSTVARI